MSAGPGGTAWIVHICSRRDWEAAHAQGQYRAASLGEVGFIHCSLPEQIVGVANAFYRDVPDLVLLWIDPQKLRHELKWEAADGQVFPHLYGSLNLDAVRSSEGFSPAADGFFRQAPSAPGEAG